MNAVLKLIIWTVSHDREGYEDNNNRLQIYYRNLNKGVLSRRLIFRFPKSNEYRGNIFPSTTYAYPLIGSADFCTTIYNHGYTLIIAPCFSADLRLYSIPKPASALIQQSPTPTICINASSINLEWSLHSFICQKENQATILSPSLSPWSNLLTHSLTHLCHPYQKHEPITK